MEIPALSYSPHAGELAPETCKLSITGPSAIEKLVLDGAPRVLLIAKEFKAPLLSIDPRIIDLKRKDPRVELFRRHKGLSADRVSMIEGPFQPTPRSASQMQRSIWTLLKRLVRAGRRNLCFMAVQKEVFDLVCTQESRTSNLLSQAQRGKLAKRKLKAGNPYHELVNALGNVVVPKELYGVYVGTSDDAQFVRQLVMIASKLDCPVLVQGETGTGKERVAHAIHDQSLADRPKGKDAPFRSINCGAIPGELLESELFGCEPGAHSTARYRRVGIWRSANGGTIFLDEIGELRIDHQVKILRALQEGRVRPVGSDHEVPVNARVIAATNRDLGSMVRAGQFREDLYFRLRMFFIPTAPLRDHPEDIPVLAQYFWRAAKMSAKSHLPSRVTQSLAAYSWPGNARELQGVLMNIASLFPGREPSVEHIKLVMGYLGKYMPSGTKAIRSDKAQQHRFACLRHLRRVDDALRAVEVTLSLLRPKSGQHRETTYLVRSVEQRCIELERLTQKPLLFYSSALYQSFELLIEHLHQLHLAVNDEETTTLQLCRKVVAPQVEIVRTMLFEQVQRFTEQLRVT